jgi:hypothetical protein
MWLTSQALWKFHRNAMLTGNRQASGIDCISNLSTRCWHHYDTMTAGMRLNNKSSDCCEGKIWYEHWLDFASGSRILYVHGPWERRKSSHQWHGWINTRKYRKRSSYGLWPLKVKVLGWERARRSEVHMRTPRKHPKPAVSTMYIGDKTTKSWKDSCYWKRWGRGAIPSLRSNTIITTDIFLYRVKMTEYT